MRHSQEPNGHQPDPDPNASTDQVSHANPLFVYIRIPGDLDPQERWERFADPLQQALETDDLGTVTGGGTQFSEPDEDGNDVVEFCGIDVDLYDAAEGLALLRGELIRLQAPPGTALLYKLDGHEWEEPIYRMDS
jgi:hypothetical protein